MDKVRSKVVNEWIKRGCIVRLGLVRGLEVAMASIGKLRNER